MPFIGRLSQLLPNFLRSLAIVDQIDHIKYPQQHPNADEPHGPAIFKHPPERNPLQVAQEQGRISDWSQTTAHVRDDKDEKDDMMSRNSVFIHPNPRPYQQHRCPRGTQNVGNDRPKQQKHHIRQRCRFSLDLYVNSPRNHIQRSHQTDKANVFLCRMHDRSVIMQTKEIIREGRGPKSQCNLRIMLLPPMQKEERSQGNQAQ